MHTVIEPQLAPPGAGLPRIELWVARTLFGWRRFTGSRRFFSEHFQQERANIGGLIQGLEPEAAARRVLIKRCRGLEDSSRYWSVWMTLDHLRIVNGQIAQVIGALSHGVTPGGKASTAKVKPSPEVTGSVSAEYEAACDKLLATVAKISNLKTSLEYAHPWFGALNAAGWHALAGTHMRIHRVQMERILHGLKQPCAA